MAGQRHRLRFESGFYSDTVKSKFMFVILAQMGQLLISLLKFSIRAVGASETEAEG